MKDLEAFFDTSCARPGEDLRPELESFFDGWHKRQLASGEDLDSNTASLIRGLAETAQDVLKHSATRCENSVPKFADFSKLKLSIEKAWRKQIDKEVRGPACSGEDAARLLTKDPAELQSAGGQASASKDTDQRPARQDLESIPRQTQQSPGPPPRSHRRRTSSSSAEKQGVVMQTSPSPDGRLPSGQAPSSQDADSRSSRKTLLSAPGVTSRLERREISDGLPLTNRRPEVEEMDSLGRLSRYPEEVGQAKRLPMRGGGLSPEPSPFAGIAARAGSPDVVSILSDGGSGAPQARRITPPKLDPLRVKNRKALPQAGSILMKVGRTPNQS